MTLSTLEPFDRPRLYERVVERLCSHIIASGMKVGDRLPSERDLARRLGVSRSSIRQALTHLEARAVIATRHGYGSVLRRIDVAQAPFVAIIERRRRLPFVMEARTALELRTAELAARRRTDIDIDELHSALQQMEEEIAAGQIGVDGDARFHHAVATAAHNPVLCDLLDSVSEDIAETRFESLSQTGRPQRSLAGHWRIARAITAGDFTRAQQAMREHLDLVADTALLHWEPATPQESDVN